MSFHRGADRPPPPASDDPRVAALAAEISRRIGAADDWLLWSGGLLGDGDALTEATALVRRRWWRFNGDFNPNRCLHEIEEGSAAGVLSWLIGNTLAYDVELMPPAQAAAFAAELMSLVPAPRRWFSNGKGSWLPGGGELGPAPQRRIPRSSTKVSSRSPGIERGSRGSPTTTNRLSQRGGRSTAPRRSGSVVTKGASVERPGRCGDSPIQVGARQWKAAESAADHRQQPRPCVSRC
jgi:hypothetical protein